MKWCIDDDRDVAKHENVLYMTKILELSLPSFKKLYKSFYLFLCIPGSLQAISSGQELKTCKSALLSSLKGQRPSHFKNCPVSQKLSMWLGILRKPEQYSPQELLTFMKENPHWPSQNRLSLKIEEVMVKKGTSGEIHAWFNLHSPQTPEGSMAYAKALLAHNKRVKSAKVIVSSWQTMDMSRQEEKKMLARFGHLLQEKNHLARLHLLLGKGEVDAARRLLSHVPVTSRKIADVRISFLKDHPKVLKKMQSLPSSLRKDEGLSYEKAKWHRNRKEFLEAAQILKATPSSRQFAAMEWKERNYIARELIGMRDYQAAYQVLKPHNLQPGTEDFANAEWLLGWLSLRFLANPEEALLHFKSLYDNVKGAVSKARGGYWMGRAYEAQNNFEKASNWYRKASPYKTIFYGQLATAKLREKPYPNLATTLKATTEEKKRFEAKDVVKAAHILKGLGREASSDLRVFLLHIADKTKSQSDQHLAVHLAHALDPQQVVWVAKKAGYQKPVLLKMAFPLLSIPQIKGSSLPEKAFVMAIIYQESRFLPAEKSHAGAMGLMQLMPATAAKEAKRLKIKHKESMLFTPHHNLKLGASHLGHLLNNFENSYVLSAAAYNAGPEPVTRWLEEIGDPRLGDVDIVDWIELIPWYETRNYVQRILEIVTVYRSLEGTPKKTLIDDLQRGYQKKR